VKTSDFDYDLPIEQIAQYPLPERTASKLMVVDVRRQQISHHRFSDIEQFLKPHDLLVLNDTKVIPARCYGKKASGGKIECLVERIIQTNEMLVHIKASKAPKVGATLFLTDQQLAVVVVARVGDLFHLRAGDGIDVLAFLQENGQIPLPPYIERAPNHEDLTRYQTVFAQKPGAVAAPTASLHFDEALLATLKAQGISQAFLTLHVGAGTFQPVREEDVSNHHMHAEVIEVSSPLCEKIAETKKQQGRVVAVGTTVVRSLESAAREGQCHPYQGETDLFILPGFQFNVVDIMLTNFHLPKSTLLMLVSAFAGWGLVREAYRQAVENDYRFFSYGDAMLILK